MKKLLGILIALIVAVTPVMAGSTAAQAAGPARIMLLGDSITGSNGCWRALLWQHLQSTGFTNVDFVGTVRNTYCSGSFDADNEGHGGYAATGIADNNQLPGWLSATGPNIVVMMLGTNDVWGNRGTPAILAAYSKLLGQMRANNPDVKVLIAQILPMTPAGCGNCNAGVQNLNAAIPGWAAANGTSRSPVRVVDQYTDFNTGQDTVDGVHPNDGTGIRKIESRWYPALTGLLGSTSTPGTAPNGFPYCVSGSSSDPDGDGWGWESSASCVVRNGQADH
jgi:mannan endo-1,4-beta-mannosidase